MDAREQQEIEWRCTKLSNAFAWCIDHRDYEGLAALFTPDGTFDRVGQVLRGREAILAALRQRPTDLRTRHVGTNFHFTQVSADDARCVIYNATFVGKGDPQGAPSPQMLEPTLLEFHDHYQRTAEGWRIKERVASVVVKPEGAGH